MTIQARNSDLQDRLDFVGLDERQRRSLANVQPVIGTAIGHALDAFYTKVSKHPKTARFFSNDAHIAHAKDRQVKH